MHNYLFMTKLCSEQIESLVHSMRESVPSDIGVNISEFQLST